ncbi:hypothetical protein EPICR_20387 [Candidatus Desulfarcum epimagneticum]|uniref:Uncharacterized protein n=1 Tax=uncultured Desulfobacteraceae bacterium TaxID=218296 RepID=A0A484HI29_9BACT|nr:hypothetical protein EPICR_20387 [uncultured Desulfobacteraceae bacterium]
MLNCKRLPIRFQPKQPAILNNQTDQGKNSRRSGCLVLIAVCLSIFHHAREPTIMPDTISVIPIIFGKVTGSSRNKALKIKISTKERLVKGYAKLKSNFVIAAIQNSVAGKPAAKAEIIKGSRISFPKKINLSVRPEGICPYCAIRHFKIS